MGTEEGGGMEWGGGMEEGRGDGRGQELSRMLADLVDLVCPLTAAVGVEKLSEWSELSRTGQSGCKFVQVCGEPCRCVW